MATVAASTEKVTELKPEEAQTTPEVAQPAATTEQVPEAGPSTGDVEMTDDEKKDKALRAIRQSTLPVRSQISLEFHKDLPFTHSRVLLCGRQSSL